MNLSDVYVFKRLATTLSFTEAARQIGVSRSTVSKKLNRLEEDLGVMLLNRTTRSVSLTEAGQIFDEHTADIDRTIEHAAELVRGADCNPQGTVSFNVPTALGTTLLPALVKKFQPRWPELTLNIQFDDQTRDFQSSDLDVVIRISRKLRDSKLIARRLVSTTKVLAASSTYLREHGMPDTPADLKKHRCIGFGSRVKMTNTWRFKGDKNCISVAVKPSMTSNNFLALKAAACLDDGIIYVPDICLADELASGELQVIPGISCPDQYGVYAIFRHQNKAAKIKVLVDFIEAGLRDIDGILRRPSLGDHPKGTLDKSESYRRSNSGTA